MIMSGYLTRILGIVLVWSAGCLYGLDLDDIMQQHLDAIGGAEAVSRVNSSITYSSIVFGGLSGTQVVHYKAPYYIHLYVDFGVMSQELGFDGKTSWTVDPNGKVRKDIDEEAKPLINELYFAGFYYALPGGQPGRREYRGDTIMNNTAYHNIALFPEGGDSIAIFINKNSNLVDYRMDIVSGLKMITKYSAYRETEGLKIPYLAVADSPDGPLQISSKLDSIAINPDIPDAVFKIPGDSTIDYRFPGAVKYVNAALEDYGGYLALRARINGQGPFIFLLDTGAGMTIVSEETADSIKAAVSGDLPVRGFGGFGKVGFVEIDSLAINELLLFFKRVLAFDFKTMSGMLRLRIDGILGYDFFARFPMKIDSEKRRLTLYNPAYQLPDFKGNEVNLEIFSQVPVLEAEVNGYPTRLLLDMGAQPGLVLKNYKKYMEAETGEESGEFEEIDISGVGGIKTMGRGAVDSLKIAGYVFKKPSTVFIEDFSQLPFPEYIDGVVGLGILRNFEMVLDYSARRAFFLKR